LFSHYLLTVFPYADAEKKSMASRAELAVQVWSDWGLRVLVLLSFALQVLLLILAEFRQRRNSSLVKAVVWSCYLMDDTTAIYVLGHLSVGSKDPDHQLMAFWAPFLLLHLGGQDNITAYTIEDTWLWLRHLQVLAVQGVATSYVLYESSVVRTQPRLRRAAILMFVVGFLKYSERVRALSNAEDASPINNY
jgi:heme A synthase